ncbi:MAG: ATP-binding protein, partial [Pseudomonadales bacterium]|nr:ATP-binding protein [Pseudomonadales bacterium]
MQFVERIEELNKLKEILARNTPAFVVIYGRRRIGKTETVRHFCESNAINYLEFAGKLDQSRAQQVQGCARKLSRYAPGLKIGEVNSWQDIFYLLEDYIKTQPEDKNTVIFLDELPWMDTQKSGFLGDLAAFWNEYCSRKSNVTLIVCGSAASYMLKRILQDKGPLHGRVTNKIGMDQFNLKSTKVLLEANGWNLSKKSITDIYIAFGGVAKYLVSLNSQLTQVQAIHELCFSKNALLKDEYQTLFHSLFKDAKAHYAI